jgi:hypothetical protein
MQQLGSERRSVLLTDEFRRLQRRKRDECVAFLVPTQTTMLLFPETPTRANGGSGGVAFQFLVSDHLVLIENIGITKVQIPSSLLYLLQPRCSTY